MPPAEVVVPSLILPPFTHSVRKLAFFRILGRVSRCFCRLGWEEGEEFPCFQRNFGWRRGVVVV